MPFTVRALVHEQLTAAAHEAWELWALHEAASNAACKVCPDTLADGDTAAGMEGGDGTLAFLDPFLAAPKALPLATAAAFLGADGDLTQLLFLFNLQLA